jgi:hypothetical protein
MNECEIATGQLVEATEDATKVLHLAEQALDPGAFFVEPPIGRPSAGAGRMGRDDRHGTMLGNPAEDGVSVIGTIGEHRRDREHSDRCEQGDGFWRIAGLAGGQREAERVAEAVGEPVQLRGEAAA